MLEGGRELWKCTEDGEDGGGLQEESPGHWRHSCGNGPQLQISGGAYFQESDMDH